jgi:hypothetical protein
LGASAWSHQRAAAVLLSPPFQTGNEALRRAASFPLGYDVLDAQQSLGQERRMGGGRPWRAVVVHDQTKQRSQGVELAPMPVTPHQMATAAQPPQTVPSTEVRPGTAPGDSVQVGVD